MSMVAITSARRASTYSYRATTKRKALRTLLQARAILHFAGS